MPTPPPITPFALAEQRARAATLGWWVFLSSELLFFGPLFMGYVYGRVHFPAAYAAASRHTDFTLGTLNTAVLLTSSLTMALAVGLRRKGALHLTRGMLVVTVLLGLLFLAIKGVEYHHDSQQQLVPGPAFHYAKAQRAGAEMFFFLYFGMTGLHALHLCAGMAALTVFALALRPPGDGIASAQRVALAGLYWHFVDLVWIVLYPLLYLLGRGGG